MHRPACSTPPCASPSSTGGPEMAKQSMLPRAIVLVCAGVGTFYAAAQWSRSQRDVHGDDRSVVQPAARTSTQASPLLAFAPASTSQALTPAASAAASTDDAS